MSQQSPQPEQPETPKIPATTLAHVEEVMGLAFTDSERHLMVDEVDENRLHLEKIRAVALGNGTAPAFRFDPRPIGATFSNEHNPIVTANIDLPPIPTDLEEIAFWPLTHLSRAIQERKITATLLTEMYLQRLKRYDPLLHCVVTLTEERAMEQAKRADDEIAHGHYRGPLHGIPYGAKDLLATRGIPTTWGAEPFVEQVFDTNATVVQKLEEAGAVLVAKLSLGALAWGDVWFGGQTRTPWNTDEGSSGSSAGSGAATAAGLVGFAIGTETYGSIVSPSTQCRVTGLRPTFGRVSRFGAMALCWTLDKIGPMGRTVEDCALVFNAIFGPDGKDPTVTDYPFNWDATSDIHSLRVGYDKTAFEEETPYHSRDTEALDVLRSLGIELVPIQLPDYPVEALSIILSSEA